MKTEADAVSGNTDLTLQSGYDVFAVPDTNAISILGIPYKYKADCSALGQFKTNSDELLGKTLQMEVLNYKVKKGTFFNYEENSWLEVLFVDKDNAVSVVLFKNESLTNFFEMLQEVTKKKLGIGLVIVTASMDKRTSEQFNSSYHAVKFSFVENKAERVAELKAFRDGNIDVMNYSLLNEVANRGEDVDKRTGEVKEYGNQGTKG